MKTVYWAEPDGPYFETEAACRQYEIDRSGSYFILFRDSGTVLYDSRDGNFERVPVKPGVNPGSVDYIYIHGKFAPKMVSDWMSEYEYHMRDGYDNEDVMRENSGLWICILTDDYETMWVPIYIKGIGMAYKYIAERENKNEN